MFGETGAWSLTALSTSDRTSRRNQLVAVIDFYSAATLGSHVGLSIIEVKRRLNIKALTMLTE